MCITEGGREDRERESETERETAKWERESVRDNSGMNKGMSYQNINYQNVLLLHGMHTLHSFSF